jgi:HNH endonuclease
MLTKYGELSLSYVTARIAEYWHIGEPEFLKRYAPRGEARSTYLVYEGELLPAKAILKAALVSAALLQIERVPGLYKTDDAERIARGFGFEIIRSEAGVLLTERSAIEDLDGLSGSDVPTRTPYFGERFIRDGKVRAAVLLRAKGRCEHCGTVGFKASSGKNYLETHHIISLAKQGPDTLENVIALCANHHREAHFGEGWEQLETEFKAKLAKLRGK